MRGQHYPVGGQLGDQLPETETELGIESSGRFVEDRESRRCSGCPTTGATLFAMPRWCGTLSLDAAADQMRTKCGPGPGGPIAKQTKSPATARDFDGAPGATRTPNLLIRSQTLYPIELRARELPSIAGVSGEDQPIQSMLGHIRCCERKGRAETKWPSITALPALHRRSRLSAQRSLSV